MKRCRSEEGVALILVLGVISALAILAATVTMATVNDKGATLTVTTRSNAFNVAEAGLDMGLFTLSSSWPSSPPAANTAVTLSTDPRTMFSTTQFPTSVGKSFVTVTMSPGSDSSHLLMQSQANVGGESVRLQTQILQTNVGISTMVPGCALYSGGNTTMSGNNTLTSPLSNGVPTGSVYVNGNATLSGNNNLSSMGIKVRNTLTASGNNSWSSVKTQNDSTVPTSIGTWLPPSAITYLTNLAQATPQAPAGVTVVPNNGTIPATATAVDVTGSATISSNGTYNLGSLYVSGNLTISGNCNLSIGSLYVGGSLTGSGNLTLTNLGPTWVGGNVTLSGNGNCKMPLLVAAGSITLSGNAIWGGDGVGADMKPCVAISTGGNVTWSGNSAFYGLLAATTGSVTFSGNGTVNGSVLSAQAAIFSGNTNLAYNGNVVNSIQVGSATIATLVPGTWAQIATQ
ncbi:MAG: hypothetical protein ACLQUT_02370 [Thermoleophilia bacterium]